MTDFKTNPYTKCQTLFHHLGAEYPETNKCVLNSFFISSQHANFQPLFHYLRGRLSKKSEYKVSCNLIKWRASMQSSNLYFIPSSAYCSPLPDVGLSNCTLLGLMWEAEDRPRLLIYSSCQTFWADHYFTWSMDPRTRLP